MKFFLGLSRSTFFVTVVLTVDVLINNGRYIVGWAAILAWVITWGIITFIWVVLYLSAEQRKKEIAEAIAIEKLKNQVKR